MTPSLLSTIEHVANTVGGGENFTKLPHLHQNPNWNVVLGPMVRPFILKKYPLAFGEEHTCLKPKTTCCLAHFGNVVHTNCENITLTKVCSWPNARSVFTPAHRLSGHHGLLRAVLCHMD